MRLFSDPIDSSDRSEGVSKNTSDTETSDLTKYSRAG